MTLARLILKAKVIHVGQGQGLGLTDGGNCTFLPSRHQLRASAVTRVVDEVRGSSEVQLVWAW